MSSALAGHDSRAAYTEKLYRLLPGMYRSRDESGELRRFVSLFADELWRLHATQKQALADHFIDSCQDWVIPYLADLVGTDVLYADAARNRNDVKNTMRWRRLKGSRAGIEQVAAGVGGWGALAVEMLARALYMQRLDHPRPAHTFMLDLRRPGVMAAVSTPFARNGLSPDLRPLGRRGMAAVGIALPRQVAVHVWPIASWPLRGGEPASLGGGRFTFSPFGYDLPLYAGGDRAVGMALEPDADLCQGEVEHVPLRRQDVRDHLRAYLNEPVGFTIREDGIAVCGVGIGAAAVPSREPALTHAQLARRRGMLAGDTSLFGATQRFSLEAVRLASLVQIIGGSPAAVPYSPGQAFISQFELRNPHGTLALDGQTPDFGYIPGMLPYTPAGPEFHHPALLLGLRNNGAAAAAFPQSEAVLRSARGEALLVFLPAIASLAAGARILFYVAADGSSYFARSDHGPGLPDRNPDSGPFGAFSLPLLARGAEPQVRVRPGQPAAPARHRRALIRSLCCWDEPLHPPLQSGEVAIDPQRGRFVFPAGELPQGELSVDLRVGQSGELGAGPFTRTLEAAATLTVARARDAQFTTVQAAIDAAPDGSALPVVIEILDSARYLEALQVNARNFPGGLTLRAAALATPALHKPAGPGPLLLVNNSTLPELRLEGLLCSGGAITIGGAVDAVALSHCSLDPASCALTLTVPDARLSLADCISGPIAVTAPVGDVRVEDSAIQHPLATVEQPGGVPALNAPGLRVAIERSTLLGDLTCATLRLSNSLLYGGLLLADATDSCLRFSRVPPGLSLPQAFNLTTATPIFAALRFGAPDYLRLSPNSAPALLRGAEEGGEIGVHYRAGAPWRMQNLALRLAQYTPAGIRSDALADTPRLPFLGNSPL